MVASPVTPAWATCLMSQAIHCDLNLSVRGICLYILLGLTGYNRRAVPSPPHTWNVRDRAVNDLPRTNNTIGGWHWAIQRKHWMPPYKHVVIHKLFNSKKPIESSARTMGINITNTHTCMNVYGSHMQLQAILDRINASDRPTKQLTNDSLTPLTVAAMVTLVAFCAASLTISKSSYRYDI
jgi:hypothetical protein